MSMPYSEVSWRVMTWAISKPLEKRYGKASAKEYIRKSKSICKQMFVDVDDIGKQNPMKGNIDGAFPFMAIWKAADGAITPSDFAAVLEETLRRPMIWKVMGKGRNINRQKDLQKVKNMFQRCKNWADEHPEYQGKTWDFNFDETLHNKGSYYYFTVCPLNNFARKYGFLEILPVMCNIDYLTAEMMHAKLHRDYTLASGGSMCDYWFTGDESDNKKI